MIHDGLYNVCCLQRASVASKTSARSTYSLPEQPFRLQKIFPVSQSHKALVYIYLEHFWLGFVLHMPRDIVLNENDERCSNRPWSEASRNDDLG